MRKGANRQSGRTSKDSGLNARYAKYKEVLKDLTIMSDIFMRNVFKKKECTEYVLRVIMQNEDLQVLDQLLQKDFKNLQGRSAVLDCVARSAKGEKFDVEIQQDTEGASPKRARYYSGLMDMNTLEPGQDFEELPNVYTVFITGDDVLGYDLPIYHVRRKIEEVGKNFGDEAHIIYVNSSKQDDTELGRLMHDFHCKSAGDIYSKVLARRVYELKETQKGVQHMCREMDKIYSEGERRGRKQMISNYIKVCQREGVLPEQLKVQLVKYFNLTACQAERYVGRSDFPQAGSETGGYGAVRV